MLAATALNAVTALRSHLGRVSVTSAYASSEPITAPRTAESIDSKVLFQKLLRSCSVERIWP